MRRRTRPPGGTETDSGETLQVTYSCFCATAQTADRRKAIAAIARRDALMNLAPLLLELDARWAGKLHALWYRVFARLQSPAFRDLPRNCSSMRALTLV